MSSTHLALDERIADYIFRTSVRDDDLLKRLREETQRLPMGRMQISPEHGQFMALLVRLMGAKRTLEVGTFTGYSTLSVASALPPDGRVVACDVSEEWTSIARRYWKEAGVADRIDLRLAPARQTLERLLAEGGEGKYDFAFIDADKVNYDHYFELCLRLLRRHGLIVLDNVLWGGAVVDESLQDEDTAAIRALNAKLHHDTRVDLSMLSLSDGVTLALKL